MRRVIFALSIFSIFSVLLVLSGCQEQAKASSESESKVTASKAEAKAVVKEAAKEEVEEQGPRGEITFESSEHDFGKVGPESKSKYTFKFKNTGEGVLRIKRVQSTCGCTVPKLSKKVYAPGEEGEIQVTYKASKSPGKTAKQIKVHLKDKETPLVALTIRAEVIIKIAIEPKKLTLSLREDNAGCPEVTLSSKDGEAFSIRGIKSTGNAISVEFDPNVVATEFVIHPKVDMEKLRKRLNGRLDVLLTHPETKAITIPFAATTAFKVQPGSIIIFNAEPGKTISKELWVLSNYDEDFEIESISSEKNYVSVVSQEKLDNRYKLKVDVVAPELGSDVNSKRKKKQQVFTDTLIIKFKGGDEVKVMCRGFYKRGLGKKKDK
ncbi:MAG: DUF1573 domain-containing protein [Planctomycetes bacterium]|nr:DUF1573 domain-containing protein [Planctomycetota bacterium]